MRAVGRRARVRLQPAGRAHAGGGDRLRRDGYGLPGGVHGAGARREEVGVVEPVRRRAVKPLAPPYSLHTVLLKVDARKSA